ncbi:MAG: helix-turn-helix domain-containing protein [Desulfobacteraceae bacterium]|nr:helix-turn-helix domain-containing protein [Desulfobacteraceae bacterium]
MKKSVEEKQAANQEFADRLSTLIKGSNLRKYEIQEALGLKNYTTVYKWETGENYPSRRNLKKLADLFNVSESFLRGHEQQETLLPAPADAETNSRQAVEEGERKLLKIIENLQRSIGRLEDQILKKDDEIVELKNRLGKLNRLHAVPQSGDGGNTVAS